MRQFLIYYDIIRKAHIVRCKGTFHVFACAKFDICTVYESITVHLHVNYLAITVRQRIRYGIHHSQSREETGSCQTDQGIVINLMSGIDHANTACVTESVANKQVVINRVTVTVSQCYYSFAFQQDIVPNHIIAGFYKNRVSNRIYSRKKNVFQLLTKILSQCWEESILWFMATKFILTEQYSKYRKYPFHK